MMKIRIHSMGAWISDKGWDLTFITLLMTMSGLAMAIICHFLGIKVGQTPIITAYLFYLAPAILVLALRYKEQLYLSAVDKWIVPFFSLIAWGLLISLFRGVSEDAPRNSVYFVLFCLTPFFLGRVLSRKSILLYGDFYVFFLMTILLCLCLPGVVSFNPIIGRPSFFSTEFSRISLAFTFGLGALIITSMGQVATHKRTSTFYALLLSLTLMALAFVMLRGPYYLAIAVTLSMLILTPNKSNKKLFFGVISGVVAGYFITQEFAAYHAKLFHVQTQQIPFSDLYLDFLGSDAQNVVSGRSILNHLDCLPAKAANDSIMIRLTLYLEAIKMFIHWPLFGAGVSTFSDYSCIKPYGFPHSTILHVAAELGILGLIFFFASLTKSVQVLLRCFRQKILPSWLFFGFIYFLFLDQLFSSYFFSTYTYFLIGASSAFSANRFMQSDSDSSANI